MIPYTTKQTFQSTLYCIKDSHCYLVKTDILLERFLSIDLMTSASNPPQLNFHLD